MNPVLRLNPKVRLVFSRIGSLLLLFQRTPVVQMILPEARVMSASGVGELAKWTIAVVAGLGAFDTVAGATVLTQLRPSAGSTTVPAAIGSNLTFVFQVTGAPSTAQSWQVIGALPAGLTHTNATRNSVDSITGIPTQTGSFPITIKAWQGAGFRGGSVSKSFNIVVSTGSTGNIPVITGSPASVMIKKGTQATLRVVATGSSLTYQWYKGKSGVVTKPIPNATAASYKTPVLTATTSYWVKVSSLTGNVSSKTAIVSVSKIAPPKLLIPFQLGSSSPLVN